MSDARAAVAKFEPLDCLLRQSRGILFENSHACRSVGKSARAIELMSIHCGVSADAMRRQHGIAVLDAGQRGHAPEQRAAAPITVEQGLSKAAKRLVDVKRRHRRRNAVDKGLSQKR